ncbi:DNA-binding transcriptional MerR regulator [Sphingomonas zeicaulis]|uniref:MerR family transcriptional regulator n=1 Tax=Sphingomonas zeicaulis TaxID=1632740 RepID=UPI003D1C9937
MSPRNLTAAQAAAQLGVSAKALRIYERHGLIRPGRSAAGWRLYDADAMARAGEVVALRRLGLGLARIAAVLAGAPNALDAALAAQAARLGAEAGAVDAALRRLRADDGAVASSGMGFALPWPWDGECFDPGTPPALGFITGPLGSGKTRLAMRLAEALPDAAFLGLDRLADPDAARRLAADPVLAGKVEYALTRLEADGARRSPALRTLMVALEAAAPAALVVDLVEEGLDADTQRALIAHLRRRPQPARRLWLMTRSTAILNLAEVGADEPILYCPANHAPPFRAAACSGGHGHEALATCLAAPEVRMRTAGVIAVRQACIS